MKYSVDPKFKEYYIELVGEENADFTVDKNGLLEDRDAFLAHACWEYKEKSIKGLSGADRKFKASK